MRGMDFSTLLNAKSLICLVSFFVGFYLFSPGVLVTLPPVPGQEVGTVQIKNLGEPNQSFPVTNAACLTHAALFAVTVVLALFFLKMGPLCGGPGKLGDVVGGGPAFAEL